MGDHIFILILLLYKDLYPMF